MAKTEISWTDYSMNPGIYGCSPAHSGCRNCYAAQMAYRLSAMGQCEYLGAALREWDDHGLRRSQCKWTGEVHVDYAQIPKAFAKLPKRKPARVFVTSMGDLFHHDVPGLFRWQVFREMVFLPHLTFQVLTKRPEFIHPWFDHYRGLRRQCVHYRGQELTWPPNIQIGASCSTQADVDRMVPDLLRVPAKVRFLSLEPLLGEVEIDCYDPGTGYQEVSPGGTRRRNWDQVIHWVIVGAESGPRRRPCRIEWVRSIVEQCKAAGVPVFVKQIDIDGRVSRDPSECNPSEWPADLRVQEFPEVTP